MKQEVIDQFRQKLLTNQNAAVSDLYADSIEGDRAVIRDDGTRWRAQDLEEGDAVFCPLHQAREGEARAALLTYWLSTLSVDRIRAEAVIYPSRFRPGFSNGRVIFCTGACKRMVSIMEVPEQVPFQNDLAGVASSAPVQPSGSNVKTSAPFTTPREDPVVSVVPSDATSQHGHEQSQIKTEESVLPSELLDGDLHIDKSRLIVIEGAWKSGKTSRVGACLKAIPKSTFVVVTTTMAAARQMALAYDAHCYADPGIWTKQANQDLAAAPRCTVAFNHFGTMTKSLPGKLGWQYVVIEDAFLIFLQQQFGLADETEPNLQALAAACRSAQAVFAVGIMIPSSVIDFIGRSLCRIDLDMHPNLLQTRYLAAPGQVVPICSYQRIIDALDDQILSFLKNFDAVSGMSVQPAVTFCSSIEFAGLLQWILQQICHQYGYDSRRIRIYNGADESRDMLASDRFNIAQALEQADELLVTSLGLSGYNLLHFFRRHFTYLHDGVFSQSMLMRIEGRISEFGQDDHHIPKYVWYRTTNAGFGPLNAKRISQVLLDASKKQCPPYTAVPKLPSFAELFNSLIACRGALPDDWLPSDFKYSAESLPMHRLRWLFSTISAYFDLQKKKYVPEWMCDVDLKAVTTDSEFDIALEGLLRAVGYDGTTALMHNNIPSDKNSNTKPENQNLKRNGTRRSV